MYKNIVLVLCQDTWLCVNGQERLTANKCVIRKPTKSPCSTPCISITTVLISIKLMYFMPSLYTTLHTKFKGNQLSNLQDTG